MLPHKLNTQITKLNTQIKHFIKMTIKVRTNQNEKTDRVNIYLSKNYLKKLDETCDEIEKTQHIKMNRSKLIRWLIDEHLQDPYKLLVELMKNKVKEMNKIQERLYEIEDKRKMSKEEIEKIRAEGIEI